MNIIEEFDTIAAIATPVGTGGVGVIRISGDDAFNIIAKIFESPLKPSRIAHGWIKDNGVAIDEVIVLPFKNPHSYTGEDVIEIQCHGGVNIVKSILELVLRNGARMAERGEFTKRAFLNKKLDLSQAEAVADLIHSKTQNFAKLSAKNLSGMLATKVNDIKTIIFNLLSRIVAGIDFPEDVVEPEYSYIEETILQAISEIKSVLRSSNASNVMRQGIKVAIVGKPNVGKSSLFNALLSLDRAIVTDIAGTTRDVLTETLDLGLPVTLIDTAGIRDDADIDKVEEIGIEFSKQSLNEADLVLFLFDATQGVLEEDEAIFDLVKEKSYLKIATKSDLAQVNEPCDLKISSVEKTGLEELKELIKDNVCDFSQETDFVTNTRQQSCLQKALESLNIALEATQREELQDLISIDIKSALLFLEEITGEVITDDILNNIFDHFCIGK